MRLIKISLILILIMVFTKEKTFAQNPIITKVFTADPAVLVYMDTVFLYVSHDEAKVGVNDYIMHEWRVFSSTDMVNWTDRGACLYSKIFLGF